MANVARSKVDKVSKAAYNQTHGGPESETSEGWAKGPFTEEEIIARHGKSCVPCRRFGIDQGDKIRLIDDFSEDFHNVCVTQYDKVTVDGVDAIASFIKLWSMCEEQVLKDAQGKWRFRILLASGETLVRVLHPQFRNGDEHSWESVGT